MSDHPLTIRTMMPDELSLAIDWARQEGWNPGLHDATTFYTADPNGFFIGEIKDQPVAVGSAVIYDSSYAFCGLYVVSPKDRGKGYGMALTKHRLNYCQDRNIGIDGVLENVSIYENIGYKPYYENRRYQFIAKAPQSISPSIVPLARIESAPLLRYDRQCFPAAREQFLNHWVSQPDSLALAYQEQGELRGYLVRRRCHQGHKIGPLFADTPDIAEKLLQAAQQGICGEPLILDAPEINQEAQQIARQYGMNCIFATARMYQKGQPKLADHKIFGITSFELG
ncbi:GNAT family N-acetyltransferase [Dongshaea marina]|uniref:GNAT family N-acetyltransferase n=1 Tax=Dongshaea marina TaxID=2047966 RepID=UPI000D3EBFC3|nr:GNAT family N-acetyltransferase [Dongshaea marina]